MNTSEIEGLSFSCSVCQKTFRSRETLRKHKATNYITNFRTTTALRHQELQEYSNPSYPWSTFFIVIFFVEINQKSSDLIVISNYSIACSFTEVNIVFSPVLMCGSLSAGYSGTILPVIGAAALQFGVT